jgi:dTDP-4-amino-4,6-dideoxygalactose transaminase
MKKTDDFSPTLPKATLESRPVSVTQPALPPLEEVIPYLEDIWKTKQLTNCGPYHIQLEQKLCEYLGVPQISLCANGTIALLIAIDALELSGEVITTPYTFVATSNALIWKNITPVFVDIDPTDYNIDARKIERAITDKTSAILAVHVYGSPCNVTEIEKISKKHGLKVIYDAAHAFGVENSDGSILKHGDISTLSFHATKVFTTFEGGAIVCKDRETKLKIDRLKNFGFKDECSVMAPGINGKLNEIQAAIGLAQLNHIDKYISARKKIYETYCAALEGIPGIEIKKIKNDVSHNYSYFPILIKPEYPISRDALYTELKKNKKLKVNARRYFYPIVTELEVYKGGTLFKAGNLSEAKKISNSVICLPIYPALNKQEQNIIISIIKSPSNEESITD